MRPLDMLVAFGDGINQPLPCAVVSFLFLGFPLGRFEPCAHLDFGIPACSGLPSVTITGRWWRIEHSAQIRQIIHCPNQKNRLPPITDDVGIAVQVDGWLDPEPVRSIPRRFDASI